MLNISALKMKCLIIAHVITMLAIGFVHRITKIQV